ncbi:Flp pilus assembly protein TadG [Methylobacterium sp. 174MFSha1.1]|uniref:TadE/TadG family type IV pilus assembly protein n=1 Tax=Methylobacterium sp. 174MFSha1.1 TaxID=1502749 RepID=UPI0008E93A4F|nr:TadE family protein [Methylobacterium sp. 174MFSha1.1]SFU96946.1 Flp pilus assembly protein TadG [Methylobacterium sp. 174MFSha1.1]
MWRHRLRELRDCRRGVASVEMAFLAWPTIFMIIGALQFVIAQYTQVLLSNALYDSASAPEPELLLASADLYKTTLCAKIRVMQTQSCKAQVVVEMMRLTDAPTAATGVTGATFSAGSSGDALLLRAALPTLRILPLIPAITAQASVVFRR